MLIFLISKTNEELLTKLNNGVTPQVEDEISYLIIHDGDVPNDILGQEETNALCFEDDQYQIKNINYATR